jgi:hypothetical protein
MNHVSCIKYLAYKSVYEKEMIYIIGAYYRDGNSRYPFCIATQNI